MVKVRAFCFKYGIFWISWVLEIYEEQPRYYYDNSPTYYVFDTTCIRYFRIGFREKSMLLKLQKFCERRYSNSF